MICRNTAQKCRGEFSFSAVLSSSMQSGSHPASEQCAAKRKRRQDCETGLPLENVNILQGECSEVRTQDAQRADKTRQSGQSRGHASAAQEAAWKVTALTIDPPAGLVAAISFAGGRGHIGLDTVCEPANLLSTFWVLGKKSCTPMLWIYAKNDH
jgi:hypothetical protein